MRISFNKTYAGAFVLLVVIVLMVLFPFKASALSLDVTYDEITCGEATSFNLSPQGGSGNYQYRLNSVYQYLDNKWEDIVDPSYLPLYGTSSSIDFTFFASGTYYLTFSVMNMNPYQTANQSIQITINDDNHPEIESVAASVAADCLKECSTDFEKAVWLHDWLRNNMKYDNSFRYCGTEGALARGSGTCLSYQRAYTRLLGLVGVDCGQSISNGHTWTAVKMDGEWYQVDVTWDDLEYTTAKYMYYLYFGLTDELMAIAHDEHSPVAGQESTHLENNYLIKTGLISTFSNPLATKIQTELDKGNTEFTVYNTDANPKSIKDIYYSLAVYDLENRDWISGGKHYCLSIDYEGQATSTTNNNSFTVNASEVGAVTVKNGKWKINRNAIPDNIQVFIASYSSDGKMLDYEVKKLDSGDKTTWRGECSLTSAAYTKVFITDSQMKPITI